MDLVRLYIARVFWIALVAFQTVGCGSDSKSDSNLLRPNFAEVGILSTLPTHDAKDFPLDGEIVITFDQKVDSFSSLPENFELFNQDGDRIGTPMLISSRFVPHPKDSSLTVSEMRFSLDRAFLVPHTKYYFMWGEFRDNNPDADAGALGIQNFYGAVLPNGGLSFTTGDNFTHFNSNQLEVISMSPGRLLSRGRAINFDATFEELINPGLQRSYLTLSRFSPIRMRFSEPIVDSGSEIDLNENGFSELAPTPIQDMPNMMVGVFDADTRFDQLFGSLAAVNPDNQDSVDAWDDFRTSWQGRLEGKVRTQDGRKTMIFELDPDQEYPDTTAKVVVVILWNLKSWQTHKKMEDNFIVGAFVHFSGFEVANPLAFPFDFLGGGS